MITVVNKRNTQTGEYIGRGTPLGNPFAMRNKSQTERDRVCDAYEKYIAKKIQDKDPAICTELNRLWKIAKKGNLILVCWCKPLRCHGDTIKRVLEEKL